jgi:hypothetical protein
MRVKVGDKLMIKPDILDNAEKYERIHSGIGVCGGMEELVGKVVTVTRTWDSDLYDEGEQKIIIQECRHHYTYSPKWFDPAVVSREEADRMLIEGGLNEESYQNLLKYVKK